MTEVTHVRPKTPREVVRHIRPDRALAALKDLNDGFPWNELHIDLPTMLASAEQLGIVLEE